MRSRVALYGIVIAVACNVGQAGSRGASKRGQVRVGTLERTFVSYVPASLPPGAPLVIAFHGSESDGATFRAGLGNRFDALADRNGFVVAYPDGYEGYWNDCRKVARYPARALHIDDIGFVAALIEHHRARYGIDPRRVFVTGHSNGGAMVMRLVLEAGARLAGAAAISASLPEPDNLDCTDGKAPVPVLILNGTRDSINPFGGGPIVLGGYDRGRVLSSADSAAYFAERCGAKGPPAVEKVAAGGSYVERSTWGSPASCEVVLDALQGGGHHVPLEGFDGPGEIWKFFARQKR